MRTRDTNKELAVRDKALKMIVKEGFDGLSMQKLAREAGVSPATIYIYFKNREDLLHKLFADVQDKFSDVALKGFDPAMSLEDGLWLQWKNRLNFILKYPVHFSFHEQFGHSPLVNHKSVKLAVFKENMRNFVAKAMKEGEIKKMEPEIFWSMVYGPFYALVKFHLNKKNFTGKKFEITEAKMRQAFNMVMKALKG
ncbi:MAG TPA: TetR/AcrR family transcriptional regulator [Flavobacteriales bacterium]|nr:TetR/AcrR family transcriptional regulator [Flavobacteriales bacterium]